MTAREKSEAMVLSVYMSVGAKRGMTPKEIIAALVFDRLFDKNRKDK